jgi:hypothetical protein
MLYAQGAMTITLNASSFVVYHLAPAARAASEAPEAKPA